MGRRPKPISVEFCKTTPLGRREMRPTHMKPLKQPLHSPATLFGSTTLVLQIILDGAAPLMSAHPAATTSTD